MKFVLLVEGYTEKKSLDTFLNRWLNTQGLPERVGIQVVRFDGNSALIRKMPKRVNDHLEEPKVIGVVSLLDYYHLPTSIPNKIEDLQKRVDWLTTYFENTIKSERFIQAFAVHEIEAWLLSQPDIFESAEIIKLLKKRNVNHPEIVNTDEPPKQFLNRVYRSSALKRGYKETTDGAKLFSKLDPNMVYNSCPNFKNMVNRMHDLAKKEFAK